ncbi:MAG: hypothetical protein IIC60_11080 [Proteobacteria bacterium]|nr:hypothetical protein [Pseudomonadota bacterium]
MKYVWVDLRWWSAKGALLRHRPRPESLTDQAPWQGRENQQNSLSLLRPLQK